MYTALLHSHVLFVTLFILLYIVKTGLMVSGKTEWLIKLTTKGKIPEMVISILFLATGIGLMYMMYDKSGEVPEWLYIKLGAVFASIPLAIIGIRKGQKWIMVFGCVLLIYAYGVSETKSTSFSKKIDSTVVANKDAVNYDLLSHGTAIYSAFCRQCHGKDGKMGLSNAKDLTQSTMTAEQQRSIIQSGKGMMPGFKDQISGDELEALLAFLESFNN